MEPIIVCSFLPDCKHPAGMVRALALLVEYGYGVAMAESDAQRMAPLLSAERIPVVTSPDTALLVQETETWFVWKSPDGANLATGETMVETVSAMLRPNRRAEVHRKTAETAITIRVNLDGTGVSAIRTGVGFYDHMLEQIARHGLIDLEISCEGDLHIDEHHTIEDTAIALGECLATAIGDKRGIERYSWALPMDETLALVSLDLSGRPALQFESELTRERVGDFPVEMTRHFFYSLAMALRATLQLRVTGDNDHHQIEALFKGFARCLRGAVSRNPRIKNMVPSSKGVL